MKKYLSIVIFTLILIQINGQENLEFWWQTDPGSGNNGVSAIETYKDLLKNKTGKLVIVAVLDSGVDIEHEDLKDNIWINQDEIPDNEIDDDGNGYVDDVHGWNFIGGPDGKNVDGETLEVTRLYAHYRKKFVGVNPVNLSGDEKMEYAHYLSYKKEVEREREKAAENYDQIAPVVATVDKAMKAINEKISSKFFTQFTLDTIVSSDQMVMIGKAVLSQILEDSQADSLEMKVIAEELMNQLYEERDYYETKVFYQYNPDYDSRSEIVKDDYSNGKERIYGNNDVEGPDANHGTHVAGTIAAVRNNDIGIDGIADNVKIMSVRVIPDGDERDKDVANGIRYAVDNGASIINMSFGKGQSWDKKLVDEAVKYAKKHDVLIVHAAGNDGQENSNSNNYPNDHFEDKGCFLFPNKYAKNWIEVGALSYQTDSNAVASFSNYSKEEVDVFAPGELIYATTPDDNYEFLNGTSMAAPVVSGIAAILRSHFPALNAEQVKEVIENSAIKNDDLVFKPGTGELVPFSSLSKTGGMVNLYKAYILASKTKGKKKIKGNAKERV